MYHLLSCGWCSMLCWFAGMISFENTIQMLTITPVWGNSKYNFDLLIVLHVWVRKKIRRNIYKKKDDTPHFWKRFLQIADPRLFLWKLPRCEPKCPQLWSDIQPQALRICKKRTQKVLMFATWFFQIFVFLLFLSYTHEVYSNHYTVCMFYCIGINNICLLL